MIAPDFFLEAAYRLRRFLRPSALGLFLREYAAKPATVGAIWPSSQQLAQQMAAQVPAAGVGRVVELGAGTGAVTRALLARGISPERLLIIERSPAFARHLRAQFPQIEVVQGDAAHLETFLPPGTVVDAIVSSLPLRSLPSVEVIAIVAQWRRLLNGDGVVIQFTYDLRHRLLRGMQGFAILASEIVWTNLPPARVYVLASAVTVQG